MIKFLRSLFPDPGPAYSNEYIDSLMVNHSKYRDSMQGDEYEFTRELLAALKRAGVTMPLYYEVLGGAIRYKLTAYQLGATQNLYDPAAKRQVQIITAKKVYWYDVRDLADACSYIPRLVKYAKEMQAFHMKI